MRISDLDTPTKALIFAAQVASSKPTKKNIAVLKAASDSWHKRHEDEMAENLLAAIFDYKDLGFIHSSNCASKDGKPCDCDDEAGE